MRLNQGFSDLFIFDFFLHRPAKPWVRWEWPLCGFSSRRDFRRSPPSRRRSKECRSSRNEGQSCPDQNRTCPDETPIAVDCWCSTPPAGFGGETREKPESAPAPGAQTIWRRKSSSAVSTLWLSVSTESFLSEGERWMKIQVKAANLFTLLAPSLLVEN